MTLAAEVVGTSFSIKTRRNAWKDGKMDRCMKVNCWMDGLTGKKNIDKFSEDIL